MPPKGICVLYFLPPNSNTEGAQNQETETSQILVCPQKGNDPQ
jgi:hypothetical protein